MGMRDLRVKTYVCRTCLAEKKRDKFPNQRVDICRECLRKGRK